MQQYFIKENFENKSYTLNNDDSFHIIKVMRKNVEDKVYIAFSDGSRYICSIKEFINNRVIVEPYKKVDIETELPLNITIAIPPLKGSKFEFLIQKATELGVSNIVLFESERNVAKLKNDKIENKISRWEKIAKEAAEQSKRGIIPTILYKRSIQELIDDCSTYDYKLIAYEKESGNSSNHNLKEFLSNDLDKRSVIAVFGSEGGLSEKEVAVFNDYNYKSIGLGKRILRAETAPLFFISCVGYFAELS
ncbi:RsmE family RNA methyltransferase [Gemelliphila palaticanis]|uniref:Ribosomal RNA small subunit methyltransferase E n=1 Tax=Gemelliphila palaticanis TaxID=81950 RepID=A0ABX2T200_9BACL|nr:RsmE family RNA methyltransferase [Gemella palaticanis]MBF0715738.1 16S rRNA (uracil(1498)-N(3))-methyltransferase [Gemella palaticanis]NYS47668.1 16S rRNA (uracil(1498)-N(3))-methyltransferase [Gemella palaticanis]